MNPLRNYKKRKRETRQLNQFYDKGYSIIRTGDVVIYMIGFCTGLIFGYVAKILLS